MASVLIYTPGISNDKYKHTEQCSYLKWNKVLTEMYYIFVLEITIEK
jgi:hypothetical protein